MVMDNREKFLPVVKEKSARFNIDLKLLDAIIQTESAYQNYAVRYEPRSVHQVIPEKFARINMTTTITEETLQHFSWGLCQMMGSTARWLGYQGPIPLLCDPEVNLTWACRYLGRLRDEHGGVTDAIVSAYNAGSIRRTADGKFANQPYVDKVLKLM